MLIAKLLEDKSITSHELYIALNKKGNKNRAKEGGLGSVFQQKTRHTLVKESFSIDDKKKEVTIKNVVKLHDLALMFKKGAHKVHQNDNKYAICLALVCHFASTKEHPELIKSSLSELTRLSGEQGPLKDNQAILAIIAKKTQSLLATQPEKAAPLADKLESKAELKQEITLTPAIPADLPIENIPSQIIEVQEVHSIELKTESKSELVQIPVVLATSADPLLPIENVTTPKKEAQEVLSIVEEVKEIAKEKPESQPSAHISTPPQSIEKSVVIVETAKTPKAEESKTKDLPLETKNDKFPYPRDWMHANPNISHLLWKMNDLEKKSSLSVRKKAQIEFLINELKGLNIYELEALSNQMKHTQNSDPHNPNFAVIRHERICFFGKGNTDSWQKLYRAVKMASIDALIALAKSEGQSRKHNQKLKLSPTNYNYAKDQMSQHTGRWYARCGQPFSHHVFEDLFERQEEEQVAQQASHNKP